MVMNARTREGAHVGFKIRRGNNRAMVVRRSEAVRKRPISGENAGRRRARSHEAPAARQTTPHRSEAERTNLAPSHCPIDFSANTLRGSQRFRDTQHLRLSDPFSFQSSKQLRTSCSRKPPLRPPFPPLHAKGGGQRRETRPHPPPNAAPIPIRYGQDTFYVALYVNICSWYETILMG